MNVKMISKQKAIALLKSHLETPLSYILNEARKIDPIVCLKTKYFCMLKCILITMRYYYQAELGLELTAPVNGIFLAMLMTTLTLIAFMVKSCIRNLMPTNLKERRLKNNAKRLDMGMRSMWCKREYWLYSC
jgi:hypothetical protein